ncbi:MAG: hypothetical protein CVV27_03370 [Candidatus Melainabacteria bacterium HGW-Melainabacteria-1]|nr:MAG: hypothetical protein CVV27_03370 [Candidatus Melainabacteria bacterium HGW-Melainabacteria-1]
MNDRLNLWKQLQTFEKRGDLQKQAEILIRVLGPSLPQQAMVQTLQMAFERSAADRERNPPEIYQVLQDRSVLQACNSRSGESLRECALPREAGLIPPSELNWSALGQQKVMLLEVDKGKLKLLEAFEKLEPRTEGLLMNSGYSYLNLPGHKPQMSWFCRALYHSRFPLETVRSLPLDIFASPRHPQLAVTDRGAGKLHLIQRDTLRLQRSWPILPSPNKKALAVCFHPDGKRIFVSAQQRGLLVMIDRVMALKKIPLPDTHVIGGLGASNKGDLLYCLATHPDTRRPDLWVLDGEKFKQQQVISLEGEAFSAGADVRDVLELTPDGQYAVVMVSKNQPALFTPCLLLIDLTQGAIVDQFLLKPEQKPINLAFPARELHPQRFRLLPMLIHGGFGLSEEQVKLAFGVETL